MFQYFKSHLTNLFFPKLYYERESQLKKYIRSQYGPFLKDKKYYQSENFYQKIIQESKPYISSKTVALDIGCATGRIVFEYAKLGAKKVCGIDTSSNFIQFCDLIKNEEKNDLFSIAFEPSILRNTEFMCRDITEYPLPPGSFTFISCINVIDRALNPQLLIEKLYDLLPVGGIVLLVDPYDWNLSPAPRRYHVNDMKLFLSREQWSLEKEIFDVPYTVPLSAHTNREYKCHFVIAKKMNPLASR